MKTQIKSTKEVTVLGAGIVGVCCALSLIERGFKVTIIDRSEPGEAASFGNAGVISPWSCVPQCLPGLWKKIPGWLLDKDGPVSFKLKEIPTLLPWMLEFFKNGTPEKVNRIADSMDQLMAGNIQTYRHYLKNTGHENLLVDSWYINVFRGETKPNLDDFAWKLRLDRNAPVHIIGRDELIKLEPHLSEDCKNAIIIKDQARAVHPGNLCKALAEKARQNGARFIQQDIKSITVKPDQTYQLEGTGEKHECSNLVLASGIWSADLLRPLGIRMPLISERGYHVEFSNPGITLNNSIMDVAGKFVVSSMSNGIRAAGTTEFANVDAPPNYARSKSLEKLTKSLLPSLKADEPNYWMGVRPSFPDNLPAIGELTGFRNLYAAFGHSHYGMGMAPATGRIIAGMVSGETQNIDPKAIGPERFS